MRVLPFFILFSCTHLLGQPNCNVYLYEGDTSQYEACIISEEFANFYQFDIRAIKILDSAISVCPKYAWAYREKSVPYLKSGNFVKYMELMEQAVSLAPKEYLGYRATARAKFFGDYEGAIEDLDRLKAISPYDIGFSASGRHHLDAFLALCYKNAGNDDKAIILFEEHIKQKPNYIGLYDYLHLSVSYINKSRYQDAIGCLDKQIAIEDFGDIYYYKSICYLALDDLELASKYYQKCRKMFDDGNRISSAYRDLDDQVFEFNLVELKQKLEEKKRDPLN